MLKNKQNTKLGTESLAEGSLRNHSVREGERSLESVSLILVSVQKRGWCWH